jgi:hypothetical protein
VAEQALGGPASVESMYLPTINILLASSELAA